MDSNVVSERLRALATGSPARSKAARLRDVVSDVELALTAGVPRAAVLAELQACGLEMSMATFETTLKRIRAQRARMPLATQARCESAAPDAATPPGPLLARNDRSSHDPVSLDLITQHNPNLADLARHAKRRKP